MNPLPILPLLLIKYRILVLGQHLRLPGHLLVPSLDSLGGLALSLERCADRVDGLVYGAESLPLARFLEAGDAPGGFPNKKEVELVKCTVLHSVFWLVFWLG